MFISLNIYFPNTCFTFTHPDQKLFHTQYLSVTFKQYLSVPFNRICLSVLTSIFLTPVSHLHTLIKSYFTHSYKQYLSVTFNMICLPLLNGLLFLTPVSRLHTLIKRYFTHSYKQYLSNTNSICQIQTVIVKYKQ